MRSMHHSLFTHTRTHTHSPIQPTSQKKPQSNRKFSMTFSQESISSVQVLFYVIFWLFYQETYFDSLRTLLGQQHAWHCSVQLQSNQSFFFYLFVEETLSETHNSQKASLFPLLVNSQCVCWLAPALCWLSHSPNCPWALWNSQPIWLKTCTHISKHCIDWNRGSEWTARGDLIAFWKQSSRRKASMSGWRERWQRRIMLFLCKWNQLDIAWMHVCERPRDRDYEFSCASPVCLTRLPWWNQNEIPCASRST